MPQAYDVRFRVLSRFSAKNVSLHGIVRKARYNSKATSVMAGPEGGVPAVGGPGGGGKNVYVEVMPGTPCEMGARC